MAKRPRDSRVAYSSERPADLERKIDNALGISRSLGSQCSVSVLALAAVAATGVATAGYAEAQCNTSSKVCSGTVTSAVNDQPGSDVNWVISSGASINVDDFTAFRVRGGGTVSLSMQSGAQIIGSRGRAIELIAESRQVNINQATGVGEIRLEGDCLLQVAGCSSQTKQFGIYAVAKGVTMNLRGAVSAIGENQRDIKAIYAKTDATSSGGSISISAQGHIRTGVLSGTRTGTHEGIRAIANFGNITLSMNSITTPGTAIHAKNNRGSITINTSGTINSTVGRALYAKTDSGNVSVTAESLLKGVDTAVEITAKSGSLSFNAKNGVEIAGSSSSSVGVNLTATGLNSQSVTISTGGTITASGAKGIKAVVEATGSSHVSATLGRINSKGKGFDLELKAPFGTTTPLSGTINVSSTANITTSGFGVDVQSSHTGYVKINLASVTSVSEALYVAAQGAITITSTGLIRSTDSGSEALHVSGSRAITLNISGAYSKRAAVFVENHSQSSDVDIMITGEVSVSSTSIDNAVYVYNSVSQNSGNVEVTVGTTGHVKAIQATSERAFFGINIQGQGSGSATINISGRVTTSGASNSAALRIDDFDSQNVNVTTSTAAVSGKIGILLNPDSGDAVTITNCGTITGIGTAIDINVSGSNTTRITSNGTITASGSTGTAIDIYNSNGTATITLNSGAVVGTTGGIGKAITIGGGARANVTINTGAVLTASLDLGSGDSEVKFDGGTISGNVILDGGSGTDYLKLYNGTFPITGSNVRNFDSFDVLSGATVTFSGANSISSAVLLTGTIDLQDGDTADDLTIAGGYNLDGTGGNVKIDVDFSTGAADVITVTGGLTGEKVLHVADITPSNATTRQTGTIGVFKVEGQISSPQVRLTLFGDNVVSGDFAYTLSFDTGTKFYGLVGTRATLNCRASANNYTCTGGITQREQMIRRLSTPLSATIDVSASVAVSANVGLVMLNSGNVSLVQAANGQSLTASGSATGVVKATSTGSGNVSIDLNGNVSLSGAGVAIEATANTGNITVSTTGTITATQSGGTRSNPTGAIGIKAVGSGSTINVNTTNSIQGGLHGIYASNTGTGNVTVSTSGTVTAVASAAIDVRGNGGTVTISTSGAITAIRMGLNARNNGSGEITISANGTITSSANNFPRGRAIVVDHAGSGAITINATTISANDEGINVKSNGTGGSISIDVTGGITVTRGEAIYTKTRNAGDVTVSVAGDITATNYALRVNNNVSYGQPTGTGNVSFSLSGNVSNQSASTRLIVIDNDSTGVVNGNVGSLSAQGGIISVSSRGELTLTMTGDATNSSSRSAMQFYVTGNATINTRNITSNGTAVIVANNGGTGSIEVTAGRVTSTSGAGITTGEYGTYGTGGFTVTSSGVTASEQAIYVKADVTAGTGAVSITDTVLVRTTGSATDAIYVITDDSGGVSVTVSAVTGTQEAIDIRNKGNGNVAVTAGGVISATQSGINIINTGTGATTVSTAGAVSAGGGAGIRIVNNSGSNVTVNTKAVTAATHGIHIQNSGAGSSTIVIDGAVTVSGANAVYGVYVLGNSGSDGVSVTVSASGSVTGKRTGIWAVTNGSGDATINTSGAVTGDVHGIEVTNSGSGNILMTISSNITATGSGANASAIKTRTAGGDATITINKGTISGAKAIDDDETNTTIVVNSGVVISGAIALSAGADKLTFVTDSFNKSLSIDAGEDAGSDVSVDVLTLSGGTLEVDPTKLINWEHFVVTKDTTISFTTASTTLNVEDLKLSGIINLQNGNASDTLSLSGDLSAGGTIRMDINFAKNAPATDTISVAGDLSGAHTIILTDVTPTDAYERTPSITLITVGGSVDSEATVTLSTGDIISGPYAYELAFDTATKSFKLNGAKGTLRCIESRQNEGNFACAGDIAVRERISARDTVDVVVTLDSSASVSVEDRFAFDIFGRGAVSFTQASGGAALQATGSATGILFAETIGNGELTVVLTGTATLEGAGTAIEVTSSGTGVVSLTTAAVVAGNVSGTAIKAYGKGRAVTVNATTVSGGQNAIVAKNTGTVGATTVSTTGNVTSSGMGIHAYSAGGAVTVNANVVDGTVVAVHAENKNRVSLVTVNTSGAVSSNSAAIKAYSDGGGVTVSTANVTGSNGAVIARNLIGAGAVAVSSTGTLTTTTGTALYATSQEGAVTINVVSATGETRAIFARSIAGPGAVTVSSTGDVASTSGAGIYAFSHNGKVTIQAKNVTGQTNAIVAKNDGGNIGAISVTTSGTIVASSGAAIHAMNKGSGSLEVESSESVTGSGATGDGINATNDENGTLLSITTGAVTGQRHAIYALNKGTDALNITTTGTVSSTASAAIHAKSEGDGGISIVVAGIVRGGGTEGPAIETLTENKTTSISLNTGGVVSAGASGIAIRNDEGPSNVSIKNGSTLTGAVRLGAGVDTVTLLGGNIGTSIIDGGSDDETDTSIDVLTVSAGAFTLAGGSQSATASQFINWERIVVDSSVTTTVSGNVLLDVDRLEIDGTLRMQDNRPDDSLRVTGNFVGSTTLELDVDFSSGEADTLTVTGNVSGTKFIRINDISPQAVTRREGEVKLIEVQGNVSSNAFSLTGRSILSGGNQYELIFDPRSKEFKLAGVSAGGPMLLSAQITFFDGFARASSMSERRLNRRSLSVEDSGTGRGAWVRQTNSKIDHGEPKTARAPKFESSVTGYQTGFDLGRFVSPIGTFVYGVTAQYNQVSSDVRVGVSNTGLLSAVGYGVGATATWYGEEGAYVDLQGQFNDIDADFETDSLGRLMDGTEATAIVISAEMGQRYQFGDDVAVTPQAQISWGQVDVDSFNTANNQSVKPNSETGYTLRAGIEAEYNNEQVNGYLLGNLYYDSIDTWELEFVGENYKDTNGAVSVEFGFGGSTEVSENTILFLQGTYRITTDSGADRKSSSNLSAGVAFSW